MELAALRMTSPSPLLVTGASGFIGSRLIRVLRQAGTAGILALTRRSLNLPDVEEIVVDTLDPGDLRKRLDGRRISGMIHLAAAGVRPDDRDPSKLALVNAVWPSQMVRLAAELGANAIVISGSSAEYDRARCAGPIDERAPLEHRNIYGASKAAGGLLALADAWTVGVPAAVIRLFNVFGPGEAPHRLLPTLLRHFAEGTQVPLTMGTQMRDFVHVDDACEGLLRAVHVLAAGGMPSGPYNVCSGIGHTVADFATHVARTVGVSDALLGFGMRDMRPDEYPYVVGDSSAFQRASGWRCRSEFHSAIELAVAECVRSPVTRTH